MSIKIEKMDLHAPVSFSCWRSGGSRSNWEPYIRYNNGRWGAGVIYHFKKAGADNASMDMSVSGYSDQELHNKK